MSPSTTASSRENLTLIQPDDWHIHFRDGAILQSVATASARHFARGIIMPNLVPPVVTAADATAYLQRIQQALGPASDSFEPLMTLYLTENTDPDDVAGAASSGLITAVKLYPAGATTNSESGVSHIDRVMPVLERMADIGLPLCVHGEVTHRDIDIFDREACFIETVLAPLQQRLPELKVILEHITTSDGVDYVMSGGNTIAATITPHHLMINRNHMLVGGIRPHYYCLPVVKRATHQRALRVAATSGDKRFFLGTDSAPHLDPAKESACGCAGVFNTLTTLSCLAHVFEEEQALDKLEAFASLNGPAFYQMAPNSRHITLVKLATPIDYARKLATPEGELTVFDPGVDLYWQVEA